MRFLLNAKTQHINRRQTEFAITRNPGQRQVINQSSSERKDKMLKLTGIMLVAAGDALLSEGLTGRPTATAAGGAGTKLEGRQRAKMRRRRRRTFSRDRCTKAVSSGVRSSNGTEVPM